MAQYKYNVHIKKYCNSIRLMPSFDVLFIKNQRLFVHLIFLFSICGLISLFYFYPLSFFFLSQNLYPFSLDKTVNMIIKKTQMLTVHHVAHFTSPKVFWPSAWHATECSLKNAKAMHYKKLLPSPNQNYTLWFLTMPACFTKSVILYYQRNSYSWFDISNFFA